MVKRYEVIGGSRLSFPDGQVVNPGDTFDRDYDPVQEGLHLMGGHIREVVETTMSRTSTTTTRGKKRPRSTVVTPSVSEEPSDE